MTHSRARRFIGRQGCCRQRTWPRDSTARCCSCAPSTAPRNSPSSCVPQEFRGRVAMATSRRVPRAHLADSHSGQVRVLVATDIAARGIHVDDIALVILSILGETRLSCTARAAPLARARRCRRHGDDARSGGRLRSPRTRSRHHAHGHETSTDSPCWGVGTECTRVAPGLARRRHGRQR